LFHQVGSILEGIESYLGDVNIFPQERVEAS